MTELLKVKTVTIDWLVNYSNTPAIGVTFEDPCDDEKPVCSIIKYTEGSQDDESFTLIGEVKGVVFYGIFSATRSACGPTGTSSWHEPIQYRDGDEIKSVTPNSYGSSRATYMNLVSPESFPNIYDINVGSSIGNAVTENMMIAMAVVAKEQGIYLLAVKRKEVRESSIWITPGEDLVNHALPSLSPTEILFPEDLKWKQDSISRDYKVDYCFGH